jgi:hypothetical protein
MTTIEITLRDEMSRQVLSMVLWRMLRIPVGESEFDDIAWRCGDPRANEEERADSRSEMIVRLAKLDAIRVEIGRVEAAAITETVSLEVGADELREELQHQLDSLEEEGKQYFLADDAERSRLLALYDGARGLVEQLRVEAVA